MNNSLIPHIKDWSANRILLLLILIVAAVLRFFDFFNIPYTYDEFSALFRTGFSRFSDLIRYGVMTDVHPAGVQVFLNYWVKIAGTSEAAVKLPFILCGLLSVYMIYKIGSEWFSETAGLIAASYLAFLQYTVMYSQIARPYSSGLFFSLTMTYCWYKVVFQPDHKKKNYFMAGYILSGALCAYNHHFSLLFAAIVGATGIFMLSGKRLFYYILINVCIFILYIPHLPVFFHQFGMKGIEGWLTKPGKGYLFAYLNWVFHFSTLLMIFTAGLFLFFLIRSPGRKNSNPRMFYICIVWFVVPFLIGLYYSLYVNAVLQYSTLIFSFPFFVLAVFSYSKNEKNSINILVVALTAVFCLYSLIFERKYFHYFYHSAYKEILTESYDAVKKYGEKDCNVLIHTNPKINDYYLNDLDLKKKLFYENIDSIENSKKLIRYLNGLPSTYLALGFIWNGEPAVVPEILDVYPYMLVNKEYFGGNFFLFSKKKSQTMVSPYFYVYKNRYETDEEQKGGYDSFTDSISHSGKYAFLMDSAMEYGPIFSAPLHKIIRHKNNVIDAMVQVYPFDSAPDASFVISLTSGDSIVCWYSNSFKCFYDHRNRSWFKAYISLKLSDVNLNFPDLIVKVYVWNRKKDRFLLDDMEVKTREGNKVVYGWYEDILR